MANKEGGWLEQRLGLAGTLRETLDEKIPGGASFSYVLGSATLLTFLTLAITGIWELFYYVPTTAGAYDSVNYIRFQVPFGWLVHGLHFYAANFMVILLTLHVGQAFFWGAFKKPREMTWILGVLLLLATLGSVFTGGPLAWDEKGFWAASVGSNLSGSIPVIGPWLQRLVFGSVPLGQLTLSRLFPLHVAIIPVVIVGIIALHVVAFRKGGAAGSVKPSTKVGNFWPEQVLMDVMAYAGVLTALVWLSAAFMTPVTGPADATDPTYVARPDWPFLWLFQLLKYLNGPLEWLGFVLIPLVSLALLFAIPWLDRKPERSPLRRPISVILFTVFGLGIAFLTYLGATEMPPSQAPSTALPPPTPASALDTTPTPGPSVASYTIGDPEHGKVLYQGFCQQCHGVDGKKGITNPNSTDGEIPALNPIDAGVSGANDKGQITDVAAFISGIDTYLQNGSIPSATSDTADPKYKMPSFGNTFAMTQPEIADVEAYVLQINGVPRATIAHPGVDPKTYAWWTLGGFALVTVVGSLALALNPRRRDGR